MADATRKWTDKKLRAMEKKIEQTYKKAEKELTKKWKAYMKEADKKVKKAEKAFMKSKGDAVDKTLDAFVKAEMKKTFADEKYQRMIKSVTKDMAQINQMALNYMNGQLDEIYTESYLMAMISLKGELPRSFELVDKPTVMRMIKQGKVKTPFMNTKKYINIPKDQRWNTKKINSAVLQGILQGEDMPTIAKRIYPIVDSNKEAAIRNARTLVNGSENAGRLDSYKNLEEQGVIIKKVWIATSDERTRQWHLDMDGQEVDLDEPFVDGNGNELQYPGDPDGEPETVYNCRCTMEARIIGFKDTEGKAHYVDPKLHDYDTKHEKEVAEEKQRRQQNILQQPLEKGQSLSDDPYSQDRKNSALWAQSKQEYDDIMREQAGSIWKGASDAERNGVFDYTAYSGDKNQPLRGYDGSWRNYVGAENMEISKGIADKIDSITSYIDKSSLMQDTWLQRGVEKDGAASFLQIPQDLFYASEQEMKAAILGKTVIDDAFCSHGSVKGTGFSGIIFNTYCPKGTKAAYCEPFSNFGMGAKKNWDGDSKQSMFGSEFETLLQRGTEFRVTKVEKAGSNWYIDIDVIGQDPRPLKEVFKAIK